MNLWRLHPVPFPDVSGYANEFDALIAATPDGGTVDYTVDAPRWWFLHHLIRHGHVLHGSNTTTIDEFEPRGNFDAHNVRHVEGVFASDDAIWPIYFATADRTGGRRGLVNRCEHVGNGARYVFALEGTPSWVDGMVYALPSATFEATPSSRELVSVVAVRPRLRVPVAPSDFPLRERTIGFRRGESVRRIWLRHALRLR